MNDQLKAILNEKGQKHCEDGPAVTWESGDKEWWLNGKRHRTDGPAIEFSGFKTWYENGIKHRKEGPAIMYDDGHNQYWFNGLKIDVSSDEEFENFIKYRAFW